MDKFEGVFKKKIKNRSGKRSALILSSEEELSSVQFVSFLFAFTSMKPLPSAIYCVCGPFSKFVIGAQFSIFSIICNLISIGNWGRVIAVIKTNIKGIDVSEDVIPFLDDENRQKIQVFFPFNELPTIQIEKALIKAFSEVFSEMLEEGMIYKNMFVARFKINRKDHFVIGSLPLTPHQLKVLKNRLYEDFHDSVSFYYQNIEEECQLTETLTTEGNEFIFA